jgi:uncharacterized RDD family membrane protein YckC
MSPNDYAPPEADVTPPERPRDNNYRLARRDQRAAGLIIDLLVSYPLMLVLIALPQLLGIMAMLELNIRLEGISQLVGWLIFLFAYYLVCEGIWQRTIGKLITGTHVVDTTGNRPSPVKIVMRTLIRYIPLEFVSYLDSQRPAGWHDRWSDTRVVIHTPADY